MAFWTLITNFGDSAVMLPAAATIAVWLAAGGAWRAAFVWVSAFGAGAVLVAATKIAFLGWGIGSSRLDFTGISGHTMLTTSVMLTAIHLLSRGLPQRHRLVLLAIGLAGTLAVGVSRLALEAHSASEVCAGLAIGGLVAGGFALSSRRLAPPTLAPGLMIAVLAVVCVAMHGHQAGAQGLIVRLAVYLSGHGAVYTRAIYAGIA
jgi:membrane-associated phospholipid phosphatase